MSQDVSSLLKPTHEMVVMPHLRMVPVSLDAVNAVSNILIEDVHKKLFVFLFTH